ncbi:helix-turn-helix transcriptional regulator [Sphingomonas sp. SUN039]|uniref:helix-turn-helix domain-containing protein n=1 Tax=Sphingomonas sp. SUN039 TaxID=2937787 RepID=UPI002164A36D|nr:helix-turn-helix transcriptional regulator [Sphingomonas sp. SUN039]UVO53365.1 helix-turn-helix transcriptional regulator [Sphingomonas sp. SUN039]
MARINPILLRYYREKQNLSQEDLSRRSHVDKGTIFRIEAGRMKRNSQRVITDLAKELKIDGDKLTASEAEGLPAPDENLLSPKSQLNVRVAPEIRNALFLVGERYGVSALDVIEFAPLLFHLAASESLKARTDRLSALRSARETVSAFSGRFKHLTERLLHDWQAEEVEVLEERSITRRDLRGSTIDQVDCITDARPLEYDEDEASPFVVHLRERLATVQADSQTDRLEGWYDSGGIRYEICREQASEWFGGDEDAADSLVSGRFSITDVPKEIRAGGTEERVAWAKAKSEEASARANEYFASLGLGDLL